MSANIPNEFKSIMAGIAENFSSKLSKEGVQLRWEALKMFPMEDIRKAAIKILQTRLYTTMPTVADFYTAINGSIEDRAENQVSTVVKNLKYGIYDFKDPVTAYLMRTRWTKAWYEKVSEDEFNKFWPDKFKKAYIAADNQKDQLQISVSPEMKKLTDQATKEIE